MPSEIDKRIGQNLADLRAGLSQAAVAKAMRASGWKWSQPTVAAIEKGERSLKLAEAEDLMRVLDIDSIDELVSRPLAAAWWARLDAYRGSRQKLELAVREYLEAQYDLAEVADRVVGAGAAVDGVEIEAATNDAILRELDKAVLATDAVPRRPRISDDPKAGPFMRRLEGTTYFNFWSA